MNDKRTFYFSELIGAKVLAEGDGLVGRVRDLVVDVEQPRPRVAAALVRKGHSLRYIDFASCRLTREGNRRIVIARSVEEKVVPAENHLSLRNHLLDRQIVDVDGRKLVRVNDLVLDGTGGQTWLVAVDVGTEGLLRRLGVGGLFRAAFRLLGREVPGKLILWSEVEAVDFSSTQIKLSKAYSKLATFHPSDLADILDELKREKAERLLAEMETESSAEVRNLMRYPDDSVGSLMSTDYIFFNQSMSVGDALCELRKLRPEAEAIYYVYVLDGRGRYVATVSLRDIVVSEPGARLGEIMESPVAPLKDRDAVYSIADLLLKYKLHAVPVVNDEGRMVGTVVIEDILERVMKKRK